MRYNLKSVPFNHHNCLQTTSVIVPFCLNGNGEMEIAALFSLKKAQPVQLSLRIVQPTMPTRYSVKDHLLALDGLVFTRVRQIQFCLAG